MSIDRFTGGALNSALFTEMVRYGGKLKLDIVIEPSPDKDEDPRIMEAFEKALEDLENGRLPLGGGVMRGLGVMHAVKNEEA